MKKLQKSKADRIEELIDDLTAENYHHEVNIVYDLSEWAEKHPEATMSDLLDWILDYDWMDN